jgi:dynein heavy chain
MIYHIFFSKIFTEINKQNEIYFHETRKKVIILPKSFLDFLNFYKYMNEKHSKKIIDDIKKYREGIKRIEDAGVQIKIMSELLEKKKPILIEQGKVIEKTLTEISTQSKEAEEAKIKCQENELIAIEKQHEA